MLKKRLWGTLIVLGAYIVGLGVLANFTGWSKNTFDYLKDMTPVLLALPTAWLAYCFNRRNSYLQALRQLWDKLIPAVQDAIQYTHLSQPTEQEFSKVMLGLTTMVDSLRGVFKNVGGERAEGGFYPYEPLKDVTRTLRQLGFNSRTKDERADARRLMVRQWKLMHDKLLLEFDRAEPDEPVTINSEEYKRAAGSDRV